ncbi:hypothetical protein EDD85DRAFT_274742 [Armillaria nabsnona]|nr:hypothetical protein EDD85DRAFT_274742 [Armillaria nabsnona]
MSEDAVQLIWHLPVIANSPNLFELRISAFRYDHPSPSHFPVLSLFSAFPEGVQSSLYIIRLSGNYFSLDSSTIPALIDIPHLRNLSDFNVPIGFEIPDEFWMCLLADMIYIPRVSCSDEGLGDSLLMYLGSYQGLQGITLRPGEPNADDERRSLFLVHHILPINSISLTRVNINPGYAGHWCLDASMLHSLALCINLEYIGVCVDEERAQVTVSDNVVVKLMKSLPENTYANMNLRVEMSALGFINLSPQKIHQLRSWICGYTRILRIPSNSDTIHFRARGIPSFQIISLIRASGY